MKKITALLLALLLCLTMFGCGKEDEDDDPPKKEKTEQTSQNEPDESKPDESKPDESKPDEISTDPVTEPSSVAPSDVPELDTVEITETPTEPHAPTNTAVEQLAAYCNAQMSLEDEHGKIGFGVENGDTLLMTYTLKEGLTEAEIKEATDFDDANDEELMPFLSLYSMLGGGNVLNMHIQVVASDGKKLAEYKTTLHADNNGAGSLGFTLDDIIQQEYVQNMLQQAQTDEMSMSLRTENGDTLVYEMQLKRQLTEEETESLKNKDESEWEEGFGPALDVFRSLASMMGLDSIKIKVRILDYKGDLIVEKTMQ